MPVGNYRPAELTNNYLWVKDLPKITTQ